MPTRPPHIPGTGRACPRPWEIPAQSRAGEARVRAQAADAAPPAYPGQVLAGRYRIEDRLGRGGTAEVFRATDLRLGRPVAVKRFLPGGSAADEETFRAEARLLAALRHPGLVTVHDAGRDEHGSYVVMELVPGATLRARLTGGPLPPEDVLRLGRRLAAALAHVHAAGIVHRDIKPTNILLGTDGEPFLADFGLSRPADESTRAEPGTLLGTIAYMAPEQVRGEGATPASDVHALGLVLLECLKGEREYVGTPPETATAKLVRPPDTSRGVPAPLVPVVAAMTHPDPAVRPTAAECARALADLPHAGVVAAPASPPADAASPPAATALAPARAARSGPSEARPAAVPPAPGAAGPLPLALPGDSAATASTASLTATQPLPLLPPDVLPDRAREPAGGPEPAEPVPGPEPAGHAPRAQGRHAGHAEPAGRKRLVLVAAALVLATAACGAALSWGPRTSGGGHGTTTAPSASPSAAPPGTASGAPSTPAGRAATAPSARDGGAPAPTGPTARPTSAHGTGTGPTPTRSMGPGPSTGPGKGKVKPTSPARNGHSTGGSGNGKGTGGTHGSPETSDG